MKKIEMILCKWICILLLVIVMLPSISVQAKKNKNYWPKLSEEITAGAAILMDVDTGTILYKKNINDPFYPASITKILSTLVAVENSTMDEVVTFSEDAVYKTQGGSGIWRDIGEVMTMEQCLYAVMLESANECAYAVAEHVGGSLNKFVKMMNEKAKSLGCKSSNFTNPHGLPDENHYVTAKDMAIIARAAYENETFRSICGTKRYTIPPTNKHTDPTYMVNHHKMLYPKDTDAYLYEYCIGGKTGYTNAAGNTLVTYAQKDGMTLLAVILSGSSPQYWNETRALFDFGFENFNLCNVSEYFETDESYDEEKYDTLNANDPYAQIDPQAKIILPKTVNYSKTTMKINYDNLPDDVLAQLSYTYGKRKVGTANIIRTHTFIDKNGVAAADSTEGSVSEGESTANDNVLKNDAEVLKESKQTDADIDSKKEAGESNKKSDSEEKKSGLLDKIRNIDLINSIKNFDIISKIKNFDISEFFTNIANWFKNLKFELSLKTIIVIGGIILGIILIIVFKVIYEKSYLIRQKLANYRNRKRAQKQYTIIRDTRRTKWGRHRRR